MEAWENASGKQILSQRLKERKKVTEYLLLLHKLGFSKLL